MFSDLREGLSQGVAELRDFFWDEDRVILSGTVFTLLLLSVLYLTGTLQRTVPYVLLGAARIQETFHGPGNADDTYTAALGMKPSWGEAYFRRGLFRAKQGKPEKGLADLEMAINFMKQPTKAYLAHAEVMSALDRDDQAVWDYQAALEKDPASADAYVGRGDYYLRKGNGESALADYDAALRLSPGKLEARLGRREALRAIEQSALRRNISGE